VLDKRVLGIYWKPLGSSPNRLMILPEMWYAVV